MRLLRAWLVAGCMFFGAVPRSAAAAESTGHDAEGEAACCAAILADDPGERFAGGGEGGLPIIRPKACFHHGCRAMMWDAPDPDRVSSPTTAAIRQQEGLRAKPTCDESEWRGRCPPGSTMILANRRGGCGAAGCMRLEGDGLQGNGDEEDATLRAVVAQESERLRQAGERKTFYIHSRDLRKEFEQGQEVILRALEKALSESPAALQMEDVRILVERATMNGFQGALIDQAAKAVLRHDGEQQALAYLRRLPAVLLSKMVRKGNAVKKEMEAKEAVITGLEDQVRRLTTRVDDMQAVAAADNQRFAEARLTCHANLDAGAVRERDLRGLLTEAEAKTVEERHRHHAAELAFRDELADVRHSADAAAENLSAELAAVASKRDEVVGSLASCAGHVHDVHSRTVDLHLALSEAYAGKRSIAERHQGEMEEPALEQVFGRTCARLREVEETVAVFASRRKADLDVCVAAVEALRQDAVDMEELLADQVDATRASDEYGHDLEEEVVYLAETGANTEAELDGCYAELSEMDSACADLSYFVSAKAFQEGSAVQHSVTTSDIWSALSRYLPREDVRAIPKRLRHRVHDVQRTLGSLLEKMEADSYACAKELQRAKNESPPECRPERSSTGIATDQESSGADRPSGYDIGDNDRDGHGSLSVDAFAPEPEPEPDEVALSSLSTPPAG